MTNLTTILTVLSAAKYFCDNNHYTSKTKPDAMNVNTGLYNGWLHSV